LGDKARLQHIYDAILEIESYNQKSSYEVFHSNRMMQFACVKQLEIIGEAANHLTSHFKKLYSEIPWQEIVGLRNILIHEYFGIDTEVIWKTVREDLPPLRSAVARVLAELEKKEEDK